MGDTGKVLVVGAGPAGLLTSLYIRNHEVVIAEEHGEVGRPKHCAGFVGEQTARKYASLLGWDVIDHRYDTIVFHTPRGKYTLHFKKPLIYHVNRPLLEDKLLDKVLARGHEILYNTRVKPGDKPGKAIVNGVSREYDVIVASDGPHSVFRKKYFQGYRRWLRGVQYVYRGSGVDDSTVHTLFNNLTPDFFQWLAPIDHDEILVGFATSNYMIHPEKIVEYVARKTGVKLGSRLEVFGGVIPVDKPLEKPVVDNRVFFIGDSVPLTKPYTGGGLRLISLTAPVLGHAIDSGDPGIYERFYRIMYVRIKYEYLATSIARHMGYWIPPYIVYHLYRFRVLDVLDYDNHYRLILKTLPFTLYMFYKLVKP